jgi:ankyrin repeat protein
MMMAAHPAYGGMYYTGPGHAASMQPARASGMGHPAGSELAPAAELNGYGLPHGQSDVYIDAYGQAHSAHFSMPMAPDAAAGLGGGMSEPPMKRFKADPYEDAVIADEEGQDGSPADTGDESDSDEPNVRNGQPVPTAMRLSTKPIRPKPGTAGKARSRLMALFNEDVQDVRTFLGLPSVAEKAAAKDRKAAAGNSGDISMDGSAVNDSKLEAADREGSIEDELDFDVDAIIDDQGHTALHWAASLARMSLVEQLIELGADIERGNYAGETPLIRAVLTTNHVESGTFTALLGHLSPSIRTIDHAYRTVVHHIALVAGVKGRAAAARSYMAAILGWTAKEMKEHQTHAQNGLGNVLGQGQGQAFGPGPNGTNGAMNGHSGTNGISSQGSDGAMATLTLKTLVDVQDVHGDTALNVAARVGNKGLVGLLLDAGADKARANKLGLKPVDFGVETEVSCHVVTDDVLLGNADGDRHSRLLQA